MAQKLIEKITSPIDVRYNLQQYKLRMVEEYVTYVINSTSDIDEIIQKMVDLIKLNNYDKEMLDMMSEYLHDLSFKNMTVSFVTADSTWMEILGLDGELHLQLYPSYREVNDKYKIREV